MPAGKALPHLTALLPLEHFIISLPHQHCTADSPALLASSIVGRVSRRLHSQGRGPAPIPQPTRAWFRAIMTSPTSAVENPAYEDAVRLEQRVHSAFSQPSGATTVTRLATAAEPWQAGLGPGMDDKLVRRGVGRGAAAPCAGRQWAGRPARPIRPGATPAMVPAMYRSFLWSTTPSPLSHIYGHALTHAPAYVHHH